MCLDNPRDLLLPHNAPQAIGAENELIALLQGDRLLRSVWHDLTSGPKSCCEDMTLRVGFSILRPHDSGLDQAPDVRMVPRKTRYRSAPR